MKRLMLAAIALFLPSVASAQSIVRGVDIGTTCRLTDSRLNPGTPVLLAWNDTIQGWEGSGNGIVYRLVIDPESGWMIRAIVTEGVITGDYALAWQPHSASGKSPIIFGGYIPSAGPPMRAYGVTLGDPMRLEIRITP